MADVENHLTVAIARYRTARHELDRSAERRQQAEETYRLASRAAVAAAIEVESSRKALLNVAAED